MSRSTAVTVFLIFDKAIARLAEIVVLLTPPLAQQWPYYCFVFSWIKDTGDQLSAKQDAGALSGISLLDSCPLAPSAVRFYMPNVILWEKLGLSKYFDSLGIREMRVNIHSIILAFGIYIGVGSPPQMPDML